MRGAVLALGASDQHGAADGQVVPQAASRAHDQDVADSAGNRRFQGQSGRGCPDHHPDRRDRDAVDLARDRHEFGAPTGAVRDAASARQAGPRRLLECGHQRRRQPPLRFAQAPPQAHVVGILVRRHQRGGWIELPAHNSGPRTRRNGRPMAADARSSELRGRDHEPKANSGSPQLAVERHQSAAEETGQGHVFGIVGLCPPHFVGQAPGHSSKTRVTPGVDRCLFQRFQGCQGLLA